MILDTILAHLASHGRLRVIMDHVRPDVEYLHRGYLLGATDGHHTRFELCLHKILTSDDDHLHSHPSAYFSMILSGSYREHTPDGAFVRRPGHFRVKGNKALHRLEIINGPVYTLFAFLNRPGQESRWGFYINGRMVPHQVHLKEGA